MSLIVDNSVSMAWCFKDESGPATDALLKRTEKSGAIAPVLWPLEAANVLVQAQRRGRISAEQRINMMGFLRSLPITLDLHIHERVWTAIIELAARYRLTIYDAAYLELALRRDLPLATLDRDLRKAAKAENVEIL